MVINKFQSYKLFYESYGYNFLLEDLIVGSYIHWDALVVSEHNHVKKYVPEHVIVNLKEIGCKLTLEEIRNSESRIKDLVSKINSAEIDRGNIPTILDMFSSILKNYSVFDTTYSEGIYEKNQSDQRLEKIENSKNVLREDFDTLFFGQNSLLERVISYIANTNGLNADSVRWYRKDELTSLMSTKKIVSDEEILSRKKIYVFNRDGGVISFYSGPNAASIVSVISSVEDTPNELKGITVSKADNIIQGIAYVLHRDHSDTKSFIGEMEKIPEGSILVTTMTDPAFLPAMKKSLAILTQTGGQLSHAAISARELKIPCVVGIDNLCSAIKTGDFIEIDTATGIINLLTEDK